MCATSKRPPPVDLNLVRLSSMQKRPSRSHTEHFARPLESETGADFFESLPESLKATELQEFLQLSVEARRQGRPFHLLLGAHTIKVGLSPVIIDLMRRDIVTGLSFNSAGLIHDLEVAFFGATSEDVQAGLSDGSFGMVAETGELFADVCRLAQNRTIGLGEAAGVLINKESAPKRDYSLFSAAQSLELPATVHLSVGTDIVAQQPSFDAAAAAAASHLDFRILCAVCGALDRGGVVANIGSAVILPEVFLKALTVARNLGGGPSRLTTANFDMITHYRPLQNVVRRPTCDVGRGFNFVGHHELMIPLLAWGLRIKFAG